jgi:predicted ATPase
MGELLVRRGDAAQGIPLLQRSLEDMRSSGQKILVARTSCVLAESLAANDRLSEARHVVDDAIAECATNDMAIDLPELLRIKSTILVAMSENAETQAEDCLSQSLDCARRQSSLSWELRTIATVARLRAKQGRSDEGRHLLSSVYGRFTEGFETPDLKAAAQLLRELH